MAAVVTVLMWIALLALAGLFVLLVLVVAGEEWEMFDEKNKDKAKTERSSQDGDMDGGSD